MKKALLVSFSVCALFLLTVESGAAQTHLETIQNLQKDLREVLLQLNCDNPDLEEDCLGDEDEALLIEKRDLLIAQINDLSPWSAEAGLLNSGLTTPTPDNSNSPESMPGKVSENPLVSEVYAQILADAETSLKALRANPDASESRIKLVEARIANLKAKLNRN